MWGAVASIAGSLIGKVLEKKPEAPKQAAPAAQPAAQQPSVFANNNQTTPGTVKMEIPAHLAGTVGQMLNQQG